ncbi:uncharacterized protein LOC129587655 [Paramacrobiotus metropolitanus]|uniref:uncharacterized protein LOC129587655 n=1 Tax=Paramacrobiotus metropolitanus TaxID=2943436 RepID=UPI0024459CC1|nr:uncharacterized protein LOC129587655 [Paramacrobiotus metropolitanus]
MEQQTNSNTNQPTLCRAGCGFCGSSSLDGMCAKCNENTRNGNMQPSPSSSSLVVDISSSSPVSMASSGTTSTNGSLLDLSTSPIGIAGGGGVASPFSSSVSTHLTAHLPHPSSSSNPPHVPTASGSAASLSSDGSLQTSISSGTLPGCSTHSPSTVRESDKENRCAQCNKNVELAGYKCLCDTLYCFLHLRSDLHNCRFKYNPTGADEIRKNNPADLLRMSLNRRDLMMYIYLDDFPEIVSNCFVKTDVQKYEEEGSQPIYQVSQIQAVDRCDAPYFVSDILAVGRMPKTLPTKWIFTVRSADGMRRACLTEISKNRPTLIEVDDFLENVCGRNFAVPQNVVDAVLGRLGTYYCQIHLSEEAFGLGKQMLANRKKCHIDAPQLTVSKLKEALPGLKKAAVQRRNFREAAVIQEGIDDLNCYVPQNDPYDLSQFEEEFVQGISSEQSTVIDRSRKRPFDDEVDDAGGLQDHRPN